MISTIYIQQILRYKMKVLMRQDMYEAIIWNHRAEMERMARNE